jgi:hypothetical protein
MKLLAGALLALCSTPFVAGLRLTQGDVARTKVLGVAHVAVLHAGFLVGFATAFSDSPSFGGAAPPERH